MKKRFVLAVLFLSLFTGLYGEKIVFSADSMSGQASDKSNYTLLDGHAFIKTESMEIISDKIELTGEEYKIIKAVGNVEGKNLETGMEFKCETLDYNRETKVALIQGNVSLVDKENDVKANAQIIEYNQDTNIAVLQIQVVINQKKNVCKSVYAVYQKDQQLLELSGNAEVTQETDTFRAQQITLNLETQDITLSGNVRGSVTATEKSGEESKDAGVDENTDLKVESEKTEKIENKDNPNKDKSNVVKEEKETVSEKAPVENAADSGKKEDSPSQKDSSDSKNTGDGKSNAAEETRKSGKTKKK